MGLSRITLAETLVALDVVGAAAEPVTADELAAELDCDRRTASEKLEQLVEREALETKTVGADNRVWWRPLDVSPHGRGARDGDDRDDELPARVRDASPVGPGGDAFCVLDGEWRFGYLNERAEDLLELHDVDAVGRALWELFPEARDSTGHGMLREALETQEPVIYEERVERLGLWLEVYAHPFDAELAVYFRDVTDRNRRERELKRYEAIVEAVNDGIYVKNESNEFTMVNETYAEMLGYPREDLIGRDSSFLVSEDVMAAADELYRDLRTGGSRTETVEATLETATGDTIETEASFALISRGDDEHERVGVVRDITEHKERERRLERQNERLESFASMLAHELRNPLTVGQIYGRRLPIEETPEAVEHVIQSFDRIEEIIDVLLVLARGRDALGESDPVPLADVAGEAWAEVPTPDATLEVATDRVVWADGTYVRHLFGNLLENAVEHGGTDVTVTIGDVPTGFYVADDGVGIPEERRDTVFEAGYTTAKRQGGTGVGLTFVRELAEAYEWTCSVTESESGGARFEFSDVSFRSNGE